MSAFQLSSFIRRARSFVKSSTFVLATAVMASLVQAETVTGIPRVVDGDTLELPGGRVRLYGIDAPEVGQPFGRAAVEALAKLVEGKVIRCEGDERDAYGRRIATCYQGSTDVDAAMVRSGYAWAFIKYSSRYADIEREARLARVGMWRNSSEPPQPPWEFRAQRWNVAVQNAPSGCPIKGNVTSKRERIYHPPWSPWYAKTSIDEDKGERWFCSEKDAIAAGWRAPYWR